MEKLIKTVSWLAVAVVCVALLSGCTNWEKKYKSLDVEHQNLKGLYDNCVGSLDGAALERDQLSQELALCQQSVNDLQAQIDKGASADKATGFEGMDVSFDKNAGTITVTLPNEILFASGKATLKQTTIKELDKILSVLRERYSGKQIDVVGHTDTDPIKKSKWKDNWQLSAERALSVLRYLNERGIAAESIRAVAAGEARPIASNATRKGKAQNRRVEVVVHMK